MNTKLILAIGFLFINSLYLVSALCRDSNGYYGDCGFNYDDYYSYKPSYNLDYYPTYYRSVSPDNDFRVNYNSYNYNRPTIFAGSYDRYITAKADYANSYHGNSYYSGYRGYSSGQFYSGASPYSTYYGYGSYGYDYYPNTYYYDGYY
jgi:hypothetical protein